MTTVLWSALLFVLKFVLILLIYWVLLGVIRTVRKEMLLRIEPGGPSEAGIVPGRLRILNPGSDPVRTPGEIFHLRPETGLGAEPDNAVRLNDPFISAHHARLRWDGTAWWIEDLGSRNGTYVNQIQVPPYVPQRLNPGVLIQLGGITLTLVEE